jgi:hypothetical protein
LTQGQKYGMMESQIMAKPKRNDFILGIVDAPLWYKLFVILEIHEYGWATVCEFYKDGSTVIKKRRLDNITADRIIT